MSCRVAPAGLVSGPRKLKIVRHAELLAHGHHEARGAVVGRGEHEAEADLARCSARRRRARGRCARRAPRAGRPSPTARSPSGCRAWPPRQPAPAAISAAVVETLKVGRPPPVPAVSSRSSQRVSTGEARRRIVRGEPDDLLDGLPLRAQRDEDGRRLGLGGVAGHDLGEHLGGLLGGEVARPTPAASIACG